MAKIGVSIGCALAGLFACAGILFGGAAPIHAQAAVGKGCFKNSSNQALYFKAVFRDAGAGGSMMEPGSQFCVRKPEVVELRVSHKRRSPVVCSSEAQLGETLELVSYGGASRCEWTWSRH